MKRQEKAYVNWKRLQRAAAKAMLAALEGYDKTRAVVVCDALSLLGVVVFDSERP